MKTGILGTVGAGIVLALALAGCQTTKPLMTGNSIQTEQTGLAPNGDQGHTTIDFSVAFAGSTAITGWSVEMVTGSGPQKRCSGDLKNLPTILTWDGHGDSGSLAPEGTYTAKLTVDYASGNPPATAESSSFILDISPPTGSLSFNPQQFTPDAQGAVVPVTVQIAGSSAVARMDSWSLEILDQNGKAFRSFDGKWQNKAVQWDGKSVSGELVSPAQTYTGEATMRDEFGNSAQVSSVIAVAAMPAQPKPVPGAAPGTVAVTPGSGGFSPNSEKAMNAIDLELSYGPSESVASWKLEILDSGQRAQRTFSGDGSNPPVTLSWDGKSDAGSLAIEGRYTARLSVDYGKAFKPGSGTSAPFLLDITPPTGFVTLSDPLFSPLEASPTMTLSVNASSRLATIDSWKMEIYDPEDHLFQSFDAKWPTKSAVWDGKGLNGDLVLSAEDYPVLVKVWDEFGNVGELKSVVPVDILVEKTSTGFRILSSRIFFKPYTADYQDVRPDLAEQNMKRLAAMTAKLKKFPDYKIRLVGHAVMIHWDNKRLGDIEQRDVLVPLSKARAEAVKNALVGGGLDSSVFTTEGAGAADPLVPDSNFADHWRNRRVAFFIEK